MVFDATAAFVPPLHPAADDAATHLYRFDDVEFDESTGLLSVAGRAVEIEPRPRELLVELLRRPDEVVSRDELLATLWDGRATVDNVLSNAVNKLRRALGPTAARRLVTLPRAGYRLTGPFERIVQRPRAAPPASLSPGLQVPGRPGWVLDRALGHPASGRVWLASGDGERRVFKFADDPERLTALKREYTFYRVLRAELGEREDFARVLSVRFSDAPFHLECEYGGQALQDWASEGSRLASMPRPARLALFLQIARSVAAAHSIGLLHKDLKPANVLVEARDASADNPWITRLTDFGSSRLLDPGRLAALGVTAMGLNLTQGVEAGLEATPLYLAPELLAGRPPSMQSDLYALGILLYQLLAGDLRRTLSTGWQRDIDDELLREDIVAATEGRPEDRLSSVADLVERLASLQARRSRRAGEREAAEHAARARQQLQRAEARRPWLVAAFASLGLGLAASLWFFSQAHAALGHARDEAALAQATSDFLTQDVFETRDSIYSGNFRNVSMLDVMRRASSRVNARFRDQPRAEGRVRFQLGGIYLRMEAITEAQVEFRTGDDRLATAAVPPDDAQRLALRFEMARALARGHSGAEAKRTLESAERDAGGQRLAGHDELAFLALRARLMGEDADASSHAVEQAVRLVELADTVLPNDLPSRLEAREILAEAHLRRGETEAARPVLASMQAPPFNADDTALIADARVRMGIAYALTQQHRYRAAEDELVAARDRLVAAFGETDFHVGKLSSELGAAYESEGDFARAAVALRRAHAIFRQVLGDEHRMTRVAMANWAGEELELGHHALALDMLEQQRDWLAAHTRTGKSATTDFNRVRALTSLGRPREALKLLETLAPSDFDDGTRETGWRWKLQAERGRALVALGQRDQGRRLLRAAVPALERDHALPWVVADYRAEAER